MFLATTCHKLCFQTVSERPRVAVPVPYFRLAVGVHACVSGLAGVVLLAAAADKARRQQQVLPGVCCRWMPVHAACATTAVTNDGPTTGCGVVVGLRNQPLRLAVLQGAPVCCVVSECVSSAVAAFVHASG